MAEEKDQEEKLPCKYCGKEFEHIGRLKKHQVKEHNDKVCHLCGEEFEDMPFKCKYCGKKFCSDHRLPESHNCTYETEEKKKEKWFEEKKSKETQASLILVSKTNLLDKLSNFFHWLKNKMKYSSLARTFLIALIFLGLYFFLTKSASVNDILNNPKSYKGTNVTVFGKIVMKGENMYIKSQKNNSLRIKSKAVNLIRLKDENYAELRGTIRIKKPLNPYLDVKEAADTTSLLFKAKLYARTLKIWEIASILLVSLLIFNLPLLKRKGYFRSLGNFQVGPFLGALAILFVLFQPPFGIQIGGSFMGRGYLASVGDSHFKIINYFLQNPDQVKLEGKISLTGSDLGPKVNRASFFLSLGSLLLALVAFILSSIGIAYKKLGNLGAFASIAYAGLNYFMITEVNKSLGVGRMLGGLSFGLSGILTLVIGVGYLWFYHG